ncbi:MAG: recombinase RecA [Candidatus Levyibacteriota bacterium]
MPKHTETKKQTPNGVSLRQSSGQAESSQKLEAVRLAMEQIEKQYGRGSIMRFGEGGQKFDISVISTGCLPLDLALGVGGVPRGRIVEIFGPEASGKTTICLSVIAQAQKHGGVAAFIDAEHALDPLWAETLGVKLDELLISQPDTGEQALEIAESLIRSGGVDVLVIDSVAALVPRAEIEGEMGDSMMGLQARLMSQALRKLTGVISKSKTVVIFTNQLRQKIGVMFGNPETTTGGLALKFYSSVRIDVRKIETIKDGDKAIGSRHRAKIVKNKVSAPFRIAEFDVMGVEGLSREGGIVDVGVEMGIIQKSGAFFRYGELMLGQGKEAAKIFLKEKADVAKKIVDEIMKMSKSSTTTPVVVGAEEKEPLI